MSCEILLLCSDTIDMYLSLSDDFHREMVKALQQRGVAVYLLSGGFHSIIETVAEQLNIPSTNIKANKLKFFYNGNASFAHVHTRTCYCVCACILDL